MKGRLSMDNYEEMIRNDIKFCKAMIKNLRNNIKNLSVRKYLYVLLSDKYIKEKQTEYILCINKFRKEIIIDLKTLRMLHVER